MVLVKADGMALVVKSSQAKRLKLLLGGKSQIDQYLLGDTVQ